MNCKFIAYFTLVICLLESLLIIEGKSFPSLKSSNATKEDSGKEANSTISVDAEANSTKLDDNLPASNRFLNWIYPNPSAIKQGWFRWFFDGIIFAGTFVQYDTVKRQILRALARKLTEKHEEEEILPPPPEYPAYYPPQPYPSDFERPYGVDEQPSYEKPYGPSSEEQDTPYVDNEYAPNVEPYKESEDGPYKEHEVEPYKEHEVEPYKEPEVEPYKEPEVEPYKEPELEPYKEPELEPYKEPELVPYKEPEIESYKEIKNEPYKEPQFEELKEEDVLAVDPYEIAKETESFPYFKRSDQESYNGHQFQKKHLNTRTGKNANESIKITTITRRLFAIKDKNCFLKVVCELQKLSTASQTMSTLWSDLRSTISPLMEKIHLDLDELQKTCKEESQKCTVSNYDLIHYLIS